MGNIKKPKYTTTIGGRLKKLEEILGLNPQEMANLCNCSQSTYYRYRNNESIPDVNSMIHFLNIKKMISADWLMRGNEPAIVDPRNVSTSHKNDSNESYDNVRIPFYKLKPENGNNGEGILSYKEWKKPSIYLSMSKFFIEEILDSKSQYIRALLVGCDSMNPTIKQGSMIYVDKRITNTNSDGFYLVNFDDIIRVKLIQRLPGNKLSLSTVNDKYKPITVDINSNHQVNILGHIVWVGSYI